MKGMVTSTAKPGVLRVSFLQEETEKAQNEVVCFVRPCVSGVEINYSHHIFRHRVASKGPWDGETHGRSPLTTALICVVENGVMLELWSAFGTKVRTLPSPYGTPIESVNLDGH